MASGSSPACFLHIPKCAGSSVFAALEAALPPGSLAPQRFDSSPFCDFNDFELMRPEARAQVAANPHEVQALGRYRAVSGHFSLPTLLQIADASSIATILREPRARLLSLYTHWRTPGIDDFYAPYRASEHAERALSGFLSEPRIAAAIDNQVCRMFLQGDPRLPQAAFADESDVEAIAADAIERLDTLGFVGVIELGESVWPGLGQLFDVTLDATEVNVTGELMSPRAAGPGIKLLTADALDLIEQRSAADLLVYDHALACAGLDEHERQRLTEGAFAQQLVRLGDLVGRSAAQAAERGAVIQTLRTQLDDHKRVELEAVRDRLQTQERTVQELSDQISIRDGEIDKLRSWIDATHASISWKVTTPLRAAKGAARRLGRSIMER